MRNLHHKRTDELSKLEDKLEEGNLEESKFLDERKKINKWTNYEIENTDKVKKLLKTGVKDALKILAKTDR